MLIELTIKPFYPHWHYLQIISTLFLWKKFLSLPLPIIYYWSLPLERHEITLVKRLADWLIKLFYLPKFPPLYVPYSLILFGPPLPPYYPYNKPHDIPYNNLPIKASSTSDIFNTWHSTNNPFCNQPKIFHNVT